LTENKFAGGSSILLILNGNKNQVTAYVKILLMFAVNARATAYR
jgi:hypothetical protein